MLEPLKAGGPYEITIEGNNIIKLRNVLIGDVWICSGQSNMEMRVRHCIDADNEVADALHHKIRLFQITNDLSPEPRDDCEGRWEVCRPSTIGDFSAVGYYFGRKIMKELDVPIGLINSSWGGTTAEAWMSINAQKSSPEFRNILDRWEPLLREKSQEVVDYYRYNSAEWEEDVHYAEYVNKTYPKYGNPPESPVKLGIVPRMPVWVHNAMIAPLIPYAIKGVLWYQGESNSPRAYQYRKLFPALINNWRNLWQQGDFPFLYVQLANFGKVVPQPQESAWAELREAQLMVLSLPNTAMASAIDIGEADNVHPRNKQEVGRRLALAALNVVYNRDFVHSGPLYDSMKIEDGKIRLRFIETGSGLMLKGGEPLKGFAIAGKDKKFVWAEAIIEGENVVVWSDKVPNPVAVRYAWSNNPVCNIYNKEGLPASPFRTDDWSGISKK